MHPFRYNQYSFTEVAPFPEVQFPLVIGKSWTSRLHIQEGWGDWKNTRGQMQYEIRSKESIEIQYGEIADCWKIDSEAKFDFGTSTFTYWFHEILGFVKMEFENYGNQRLSIELEEVIDGGS